MNKHVITIAVTFAAAASIFAVLSYNGAKMAAANSSENSAMHGSVVKAVVQYPEVAVMAVTKGSYQAEVIGYGEARSRYQLTLTSEVSGQVESLGQNFATGKLLKQGEVIIKIDDTDYLQTFSSAQVAVADAKLALLEEQRQGLQARLEWQNSGISGGPDSPLVLREPQLIAAQATFKNAQSQLTKAQRDLDKTAITAPFSALVVSRDVQLGSYLQVGNTIATLYSTDRMEIEIPLSAHQWTSLPNLSGAVEGKWPVTLTNTTGDSQWLGYVERVEQHLDNSSRQRALVVVVELPLAQQIPLFPGTFVTATVQGKALDNLWQLPASAISQNGEVWYIGAGGNLATFTAQQQFAQGELSYIKPMTGIDSANIIIRPLHSYVQGMQVIAKLANPSDMQLADVSASKMNSERNSANNNVRNSASMTINNVSVKL
ncbi:efflux RND transporter periplasmic adaptor subunit [Moritella sp.]|uniref:efflux RND transporter periplasmic adaptor subunit n=1 Tax=Moritella sp. TaxID=78556 RepID=UPI001DE50A5C|nr:efflux RND transporter periplasmic adaptor subunit [Moritella sp.]MCJ8350426.1 efflux RND transporter periplasmic adaptor subunit [Moritella sp.]NQZ40121.1 efflux RND transporter periplasmic adaptor subunit [Moritella sp.]